MTKERKINVFIAIIIATVIIAVVSITMRLLFVTDKSNDVADIPSNTESAVLSAASDADPVDTISEEKDVSPIDESIFDEPSPAVFDVEKLLGKSSSFQDSDALTIEFDGLTIKPGMKVSDITDASHWYSLRETAIVQPDDAGYLILNNDFWTSEEIQLNSDSNARNGEIILWVHNYFDKPMEMRDCVIYKYKVNYRGCSDIYTEQPQLSYLGKYSLGYKGTYNGQEQIERAADNGDVYIRHIFGNVSDCQVILDHNDDEGLFAITVSCNEFFGPDFDMEDGDNGV